MPIKQVFHGEKGDKMHIIDSDKVMYHGLNGYSEEYKQGYFDAMGAPDETLTIIEDIKMLHSHPTEAIVLFYNMDNLTHEELENVFKMVKYNFEDNKVIALPDKTSLESCSKDVLENYISMISEIIEEL